MNVARVRDEHGSHIEPPLDPSWPDLDRLRWHLAVALHDARLPADAVTIHPGRVSIGGVPVSDVYEIRYRGIGGWLTGSHLAGGFGEAWALISGIGLGFAVAHGAAPDPTRRE